MAQLQVADQQHPANEQEGRRIVAIAWLIIMVTGWAILGVMLMTSPGTVDRFWEWSRDLPLVLQVVVWIVLLPWMVAIAIWESDWATGLRVSAISVAAIAWILGSWPGVGR